MVILLVTDFLLMLGLSREEAGIEAEPHGWIAGPLKIFMDDGTGIDFATKKAPPKARDVVRFTSSARWILICEKSCFGRTITDSPEFPKDVILVCCQGQPTFAMNELLSKMAEELTEMPIYMVTDGDAGGITIAMNLQLGTWCNVKSPATSRAQWVGLLPSTFKAPNLADYVKPFSGKNDIARLRNILRYPQLSTPMRNEIRHFLKDKMKLDLMSYLAANSVKEFFDVYIPTAIEIMSNKDVQSDSSATISPPIKKLQKEKVFNQKASTTPETAVLRGVICKTTQSNTARTRLATAAVLAEASTSKAQGRKACKTTASTTAVELFCFCQKPDDGTRYVECSGLRCKYGGWIHAACAELEDELPAGKWLCASCNPQTANIWDMPIVFADNEEELVSEIEPVISMAIDSPPVFANNIVIPKTQPKFVANTKILKTNPPITGKKIEILGNTIIRPASFGDSITKVQSGSFVNLADPKTITGTRLSLPTEKNQIVIKSNALKPYTGAQFIPSHIGGNKQLGNLTVKQLSVVPSTNYDENDEGLWNDVNDPLSEPLIHKNFGDGNVSLVSSFVSENNSLSSFNFNEKVIAPCTVDPQMYSHNADTNFMSIADFDYNNNKNSPGAVERLLPMRPPMTVAEEVALKPHACKFPLCNKRFKLKGTLRNHLLLHEDPKLPCRKCKALCKNRADRVRHENKCNQEETEN